MAENDITLVFHYDGRWIMHKSKGLEYVDGKECTKVVDADFLSHIELSEFISDIVHYDPRETLNVCWERKSHEFLPKFNPILSDNDVLEMCSVHRGDEEIHIYVDIDKTAKRISPTRESPHSPPVMPIPDVLPSPDSGPYKRKKRIARKRARVEVEQEEEDQAAFGLPQQVEPQQEDEVNDTTARQRNTRSSSQQPSVDEGIEVFNLGESSESDGTIGSVSSYHAHGSELESDGSSSSDGESEYKAETFERDEGPQTMQVGATYVDINAFRDALRAYAIANHFGCRFIHNERKRIMTLCRKVECTWRLHASRLQDGITFQVKSMTGQHNCEAVNLVSNNMASQYWVCNRIVDWLKAEPKLTVKAIKIRVKQQFSVDLNYYKIYRAKALALEKIYGSTEESFNKIPSLYRELLKRNPGSIIKFDSKDDGRFHRLFVALKACTDGFKAGCRPFLGLDGCHLKSKYEGILLGATSLDANYGLFPVAFAIVDSETFFQWKWFLECLKEAIGEVPNLTFMSDRAKGLIDAIKDVYPGSENRFCMTHFYKNFKKKFPGKAFEKVLWETSRSYVKEVYDTKLEKLKQLTEQGHQWVVSQQTLSWSRCSYGEGAKLHYITNNMAESFNNFVGEDRLKSYVDLIDGIRQKLMVKLDHRRRHATKWEGSLVPRIRKYVIWVSREAIKAGNVYRSGEHEAEIDNGVFRATVDLEKGTCRGRMWQVSGLPCTHVAATVLVLRRKIEDYVSDYYLIERYKLAYGGKIAPMPDKTMWQGTTETVLPPYTTRRRGRPKRNRIKDTDETTSSGVAKSRKTCGRCGGIRHNRRRCDAPINPPPMQPAQTNTQGSAVSSEVGSSKGRSVKCRPVRGMRGRCTRGRATGGKGADTFARSTQ